MNRIPTVANIEAEDLVRRAPALGNVEVAEYGWPSPTTLCDFVSVLAAVVALALEVWSLRSAFANFGFGIVLALLDFPA